MAAVLVQGAGLWPTQWEVQNLLPPGQDWPRFGVGGWRRPSGHLAELRILAWDLPVSGRAPVVAGPSGGVGLRFCSARDQAPMATRPIRGWVICSRLGDWAPASAGAVGALALQAQS